MPVFVAPLTFTIVAAEAPELTARAIAAAQQASFIFIFTSPTLSVTTEGSVNIVKVINKQAINYHFGESDELACSQDEKCWPERIFPQRIIR